MSEPIVTTATFSVNPYKHYDPNQGVSEEVTTEDGKHLYWRLAVPMPRIYGVFRKLYGCGCWKVFKSEAAYELHYRKAYYEEEHLAGAAK